MAAFARLGLGYESLDGDGGLSTSVGSGLAVTVGAERGAYIELGVAHNWINVDFGGSDTGTFEIFQVSTRLGFFF
ncbi:MAG: hypothetical protein ACQEXJ_10735 [Myxococcota bacterium]